MKYTQRLLFILLSLYLTNAHAAADSYRWFHVTIETPIAIFLFLLPMVLFPAVLMALLYWRYAVKRAKEMKMREESESSAEPTK